VRRAAAHSTKRRQHTQTLEKRSPCPVIWHDITRRLDTRLCPFEALAFNTSTSRIVRELLPQLTDEENSSRALPPLTSTAYRLLCFAPYASTSSSVILS
jgi:hypothetical protein